MIQLPVLTADRLHWQLPLSDDGIDSLLRCLLCVDSGRAKLQYTELLSDEPSLLLWSVCRSPQWVAHPPDGIPDVAGWLTDHGLHALRWDEGHPPPAQACDPPQLQRWAELAGQSVGVSWRAAKRSGDREGSLPALLGSLHNARAWLASCRPAGEEPLSHQEATCLPDWLVEWLGDLASQEPRDPTALIVAQLVASPPKATGADPASDAAAEAANPAGDVKSVHRVRERWLSSRAGFGGFLPEAIHKLARLRSLEEHFHETLETEKLEALKAFAYGASHEINNPLANISTRAQTLLREETDPERRRKLAVINSQAFRAHELIADLMLFARPPELSVAPVDLVTVVDQVVAELAADAAAQRTTLTRLPAASPVIVSADRGHLSAALKALCVNSLEALRLGGRIEISVHAAVAPPQDSAGGAWAEIVVADTGPGIPPEVRRHLFDPYFSGREAGRGLGLGLTKSWRIVTGHGGRIDVDSVPQQGATFRIRLPASRIAGP